jgi:hypothetical protein
VLRGAVRPTNPSRSFRSGTPTQSRRNWSEEGYNKLNEQKMADDVDDWENEVNSTAAAHKKRTKAEHMHVCTRVVQVLWAEVSTEVKREKAEIREELATERQAEENSDERTRRQYQE